MFRRDYPATKLIHERMLQCFGEHRGISVLPKPLVIPRPETVHRHSYVFPSPAPGIVTIYEWTDPRGPTDHHLVHI